MGFLDYFKEKDNPKENKTNSIPEESSEESSEELFESNDENVSRETTPKKKKVVLKKDYFPEDTQILDNDYSPNKTSIFTIINQKGGVGKSTTAINLAAALGEFNKKVLIIDLDPQGNTTSGFGVEKRDLDHCIYDVLLRDYPIHKVVSHNVSTNVDIVPATINLAGAEVELVSEIARENRLKDAVNLLVGKYDYIFIDCPPSLGLLTVNALVAADDLIIPIQTEFYALEGVTKLLESMKRVKSRLNPNLDIYGVLLTMFDGRTTLSKQVAYEVQNFFGDLVFETRIPRTVKISEAPSFGQPVITYQRDCVGSKAYYKLAKEVIDRG